MEDTTATPVRDRASRPECPSRPLLDQISDKWSMLALEVIAEGPTRFNALRRRLDGITQRVLTQTLRRLERNGMIHREVLPTSPVGVEYSLTPLGASLREPFEHLSRWAAEHAEAVSQHQRDYDERSTEAAVPSRPAFERPGVA